MDHTTDSKNPKTSLRNKMNTKQCFIDWHKYLLYFEYNLINKSCNPCVTNETKFNSNYTNLIFPLHSELPIEFKFGPVQTFPITWASVYQL